MCNKHSVYFLVFLQHGEQQRGGVAPQQARQVPAAPTRELRPVSQVRVLRQVVHQHGQRQPAQCLEDALRSQHLPGQSQFRTSNKEEFF